MLSGCAWGQAKTQAQAEAVSACFVGTVEGDTAVLFLTGVTGSQWALISGRVNVLRNETDMFRV